MLNLCLKRVKPYSILNYIMDRYELIESFPSSFPKYQVSLIAETLRNSVENPCKILYDKEDLLKGEATEDIIEDLAFNHKEKLTLFMDVKNHYFNSRRVNAARLAEYLKRKYGYDPVKISEFKDDKNALLVMLFAETYNQKENEIDNEDFTEARIASYVFKERRDRMTRVEDQIDFDSIIEEIPEFVSIMRSDVANTKVDWYKNESLGQLNILFRQIKGRKVEPRIKETENMIEVEYIENFPVKETAIQFSKESYGTEIQCYSSVSSWDETLMRFFTSTIGKNYTERLESRGSVKTKEIMEEIKENTADESTDAEIAGSQVGGIVSNNIEKAAEEVEETESDISEDFVKSKLKRITVTGVHVDSEDSTFEIHSDEGIENMINEYDGIASSLAQAVSNASIDDITIYANIPSDTDEDSEVIMEKGEWYMSSGGDEATMKALESVLK
jgi:hypothetical protein